MKTLTKEFLEELATKHQDALTFGEADEILKAYDKSELVEMIAGAFAYGYEKGVNNISAAENE